MTETNDDRITVTNWALMMIIVLSVFYWALPVNMNDDLRENLQRTGDGDSGRREYYKMQAEKQKMDSTKSARQK